MSAGGALGGILASVFAPLALETSDADLQTVTACALAVVTLVVWRRTRWGNRLSVAGALVCSAAALTVASGSLQSSETDGAVLTSVRTFYGTLRVVESTGASPANTMRELVNGHISHAGLLFQKMLTLIFKYFFGSALIAAINP